MGGGDGVIGYLRWSEERGISMERRRLLGLPVLQVSLSPSGRRVGQAARQLKRQGVRRVLAPKGFERWELLERHGVCGVDPLPLYRAMADRLVMAELGHRGVEVHRACVALRGEYVDGDLVRTAHLLCPRVRTLLIQVEQGGEKLTRELYRTFGAGVPLCAQADVAVRFGGGGEEGELVLCGRPELLGWELDVPELVFPEEVQPLPLLTVLWQVGGVNLDQIRVFDKKCS